MAERSRIPSLQSTTRSQQLVVNGESFLMLAAELQNSSMTSSSYMSSVWPGLVEVHINTVLGCVTWESIEPEEGRFDFSELDRIITDARSFGLKLVLLWFGSFKNGRSALSLRNLFLPKVGQLTSHDPFVDVGY